MKSKSFDKVLPYCYFITRISDGMKYVGIRYANVKKNLTPTEDFARVYFTSGRLKKDFKSNPENYKFRLVYTFEDINELMEWERSVTLRIYKRKDWANNGWGTNFGDNPEIGKLISEGKTRIKSSGKSSIEEGAEKLKDWIWNTSEGQQWRDYFSNLQKEFHANKTPEEVSTTQQKRLAKLDFKELSTKAKITRSKIKESGLTCYQEVGIKSKATRKEKGLDSLIGKKRNETYNKKLGEMSEEDFKNFCKDKTKRVITGATTRRNSYLNSIK